MCLFVDCCLLLRVVRFVCSLFVVRCSLLVVCGLSFGVCCLLFLLVAYGEVLIVGRRLALLFGVCC